MRPPFKFSFHQGVNHGNGTFCRACSFSLCAHSCLTPLWRMHPSFYMYFIHFHFLKHMGRKGDGGRHRMGSCTAMCMQFQFCQLTSTAHAFSCCMQALSSEDVLTNPWPSHRLCFTRVHFSQRIEERKGPLQEKLHRMQSVCINSGRRGAIGWRRPRIRSWSSHH